MTSMMKTPISRMLLVLAIINDAPGSLVIDVLAALERGKEQGGTNGECDRIENHLHQRASLESSDNELNVDESGKC